MNCSGHYRPPRLMGQHQHAYSRGHLGKSSALEVKAVGFQEPNFAIDTNACSVNFSLVMGLGPIICKIRGFTSFRVTNWAAVDQV